MAICETCECVFEPKRRKSGRFCSGQCYWARGPDSSRQGTSGRLTTAWDHPLAPRSGRVAYSRLVLYDKIGPGPHPCHWCGKLVDWTKGIKSDGLIVDHRDWDSRNDEPDNLVASCNSCNTRRAAPGRRSAIGNDESSVPTTGGYRTRAIECTCVGCGTTFLAPPSMQRRYCSRRCYHSTPGRQRKSSRTPEAAARNATMRERYEAGETLQQLADSYGVSRRAIHDWIVMAGGQIRHRGPQKENLE